MGFERKKDQDDSEDTGPRNPSLWVLFANVGDFKGAGLVGVRRA